MRYLVTFQTREHTDAGDPKVAKELLRVADQLLEWEKDRTIIFGTLMGSLTPLLTYAIFEAESNDDIYAKILSLPGLGYLHTEIRPAMSIQAARDWLARAAQQTR